MLLIFALSNSTKPRKAMRLAAMLSTRLMAVEAPCEAASTMFTALPFSNLISPKRTKQHGVRRKL